MNDRDKDILAAALKKMVLIFSVAVISVLGTIAGGFGPAVILLLICAVFSHNDPAVGMVVSMVAIPLFYIGAPIGFVLAWKWSWEHLVKKAATDERRGFPVIENSGRGS